MQTTRVPEKGEDAAEQSMVYRYRNISTKISVHPCHYILFFFKVGTQKTETELISKPCHQIKPSGQESKPHLLSYQLWFSKKVRSTLKMVQTDWSSFFMTVAASSHNLPGSMKIKWMTSIARQSLGTQQL